MRREELGLLRIAHVSIHSPRPNDDDNNKAIAVIEGAFATTPTTVTALALTAPSLSSSAPSFSFALEAVDVYMLADDGQTTVVFEARLERGRDPIQVMVVAAAAEIAHAPLPLPVVQEHEDVDCVVEQNEKEEEQEEEKEEKAIEVVPLAGASPASRVARSEGNKVMVMRCVAVAAIAAAVIVPAALATGAVGAAALSAAVVAQRACIAACRFSARAAVRLIRSHRL